MPNTRKLYYEDVFCTQFCAAVLSCTPQNGDFAVTLDATAFYPEGGGQPADRGALGGARVLDVHEKDGEIIHTVTAPLRVGEVVQGDVDRLRRFDHMQQHTGEHLLSGIVREQFSYENVGFRIGEREVTVDFSGPLTAAEVEELERAANWAVWQDLPVTVSWPDAEALARLSYRSKKELSGAVRIVTIENTDVCACCGTHVPRTGQVGSVKIISAQSYKGGTRLSLLFGRRAFADYCAKFEKNRAVSAMLSAKPDETAQAVERLLRENEALRAEKAARENRLFALRAQSLAGARNALVFEDALSPDGLRRLCIALCAACPGAAAAFSGSDAEGWRYAVGGTGDVRALCKKMNEALNGRGGGKEIQQGTAACTRAQIEAFFAAAFAPNG